MAAGGSGGTRPSETVFTYGSPGLKFGAGAAEDSIAAAHLLESYLQSASNGGTQ